MGPIDNFSLVTWPTAKAWSPMMERCTHNATSCEVEEDLSEMVLNRLAVVLTKLGKHAVFLHACICARLAYSWVASSPLTPVGHLQTVVEAYLTLQRRVPLPMQHRVPACHHRHLPAAARSPWTNMDLLDGHRLSRAVLSLPDVETSELVIVAGKETAGYHLDRTGYTACICRLVCARFSQMWY